MKDASEVTAEADNTAATKLIGGEKRLPPLSPKDFRVFNSLAERMDMFHNHFRQTWKMLYDACASGRRLESLSLRDFLRRGLDFCRMLELHHSIEERVVFPYLAKRMPTFKHNAGLVQQHRQIHAGLEKMEEYLAVCLRGTRELQLDELKEIMDGFGEVLWSHLDQEVRDLGAENMRRFWTVDEMKAIPL